MVNNKTLYTVEQQFLNYFWLCTPSTANNVDAPPLITSSEKKNPKCNKLSYRGSMFNQYQTTRTI